MGKLDRPARFVALFRGINVGGHNRVAMVELRRVLVDLGLDDVNTLLQSGNAVFSTRASEPSMLAEKIASGLKAGLDLECQVIVRTSGELTGVVAINPLAHHVSDPARHLVGFLDRAPDANLAAGITELPSGSGRAALLGRELYLWCPEGVLASPLARVPWERRLGVSITMRNWSTVIRLETMARG